MGKGPLEEKLGWIHEMPESKNVTSKLLCFEPSTFIELVNRYSKDVTKGTYTISNEKYQSYKNLLYEKHILKINIENGKRKDFLKIKLLDGKHNLEAIVIRYYEMIQFLNTNGNSGN